MIPILKIDKTFVVQMNQYSVQLVSYIMSLEFENHCKVWSRFDGTRKDGSIVKLRIQDIDWNKHERDAIDFLMKYFVKDEAFFKASGISKNDDAVTEYKELFYFFCTKEKPHISVCFVDDHSQTDEIIGISIISLKKDQSDDDFKDFKPKTKEVENLFNIVQVTENTKVTFKDYKSLDLIYEGRGISVRPDYRGLGIANEFVRLRKQICIDNNVKVTRAWMTSIGTQKAADKYNWKTLVELPVDKMASQTGLFFEANVSTFKLMYTTKD